LKNLADDEGVSAYVLLFLFNSIFPFIFIFKMSIDCVPKSAMESNWKRVWLSSSMTRNFLVTSILSLDVVVAKSSKKSGGSYLIGTKRTFDVYRVVTIHGSLIELECVRIGCGGFFTYIPAVYLSLDVNSLSYVLFVEDVVAIVNRRKPTDKILVLEDFNMRN
jgi:hypothetical protein